ncbi:MAG: dihydrofolate reductase [Gammaproteobacteria bacterium]|nr:dihydrofolate reductase [Gammaproteobacteria bacterium]MCW5584336.1 dihydrofolate reductase [Gammaproteobacteria bacterium]
MNNLHLPIVSAIAAMSENRVIGNNNQLPWQLPADLKHFKVTTTSHPIIMGRKTFESIGRPLPNRSNIIMTHHHAFQAPGCVIAVSVKEALQHAATLDNKEIFIIGGAEIYKQFMSYITRIYLTIIHHTFIGDAYFPMLPANTWKERERIFHEPDEENAYPYSFVILEKQ